MMLDLFTAAGGGRGGSGADAAANNGLDRGSLGRGSSRADTLGTRWLATAGDWIGEGA